MRTIATMAELFSFNFYTKFLLRHKRSHFSTFLTFLIFLSFISIPSYSFASTTQPQSSQSKSPTSTLTPEILSNVKLNPETTAPQLDNRFSLRSLNKDNIFTIPPIELIVDVNSASSIPKFQLWDITSNHLIPLSDFLPQLSNSTLILPVPELESGNYELRWTLNEQDGILPFAISAESFGTDGEKVIRPSSQVTDVATGSQSSKWFFAGAAIMLALLLSSALRKRRFLAITIFFLISGLGLAGSILTSPESQSQSAPSLSKCRTFNQGSVERYTCLRDYVFASASSPGAMMDVLDSLRTDFSVVGPPELQSCHNVSHLLGRLLVEKDFPISQVVSADKGLCAFGLMHGALENGARLSTDQEWRTVLVDVCSSFTGESALQCAHGAGHGTALRTNNSLTTGVPMCKEMTGPLSEKLIWQCATGLFMGYGVKVNIAMRYNLVDDLKAALPDPNEIYLPAICPSFEDPIRNACWLGAFRHLGLDNYAMFANDERFTSLRYNLDLCQKQSDAEVCAGGVALRAADPASGRTESEIAATCSLYSQSVWEGCSRSLVNSSAGRNSESPDNNRFEKAAEVCDALESARKGSKNKCLKLLDDVGPDLR